jgi:Na+-transporting NADH:ubiquinone oxidoreductase subunit A
VALLPQQIRFIKPRLKVKVGDRVKVGTALIEDKRNPEIRFLSPGGGAITEINLGPRRVIEEMVIALDREEAYETFEPITDDDLRVIDKESLVQSIIAGGLWQLIRELPFRDTARPDFNPPGIFVTLDNLEPFQPQPQIYLDGKKELLEFGIEMLKKLSDGPVHVFVGQENYERLNEYHSLITHTYAGSYPAHDPGVLLYQIKKTPKDNHAWYIGGQDLLLLAELLKTGKYPTERMVVLSGCSVSQRMHIKTRMGVPLRDLLQGQDAIGSVRYVAGGVFTGYTGNENTYMGFFEKSLLLLPAGEEKGDLFDWMMPGYRKPSYSRTFLSTINPADLDLNCNRHGGLRACISCNHCPRVCPVDILPQLTYKAVLAGEVEEALAHGLLDCVECGLCSYVCPAKLELTETFQRAKEDFYKEIG